VLVKHCKSIQPVIYNLYDLRFSRRWLWRMPSSGMWILVDLVCTDISEERIASIFRVEESASEEQAWESGCRLTHHSKCLFPSHSPFCLSFRLLSSCHSRFIACTFTPDIFHFYLQLLSSILFYLPNFLSIRLPINIFLSVWSPVFSPDSFLFYLVIYLFVFFVNFPFLP
jgi:hypothetical protein